MHPLFERASGLTETIIAAAMEVHRDKGPGLIESIYEWCLLKELSLHGLECVSQKFIPDRIQRLHTGGATALRCAGGKLPAGGGQSCREDFPDPQGAIVELHEPGERSYRTTHQLPRGESHRRRSPFHSAWRERVSELIHQERTE